MDAQLFTGTLWKSDMWRLGTSYRNIYSTSALNDKFAASVQVIIFAYTNTEIG